MATARAHSICAKAFRAIKQMQEQHGQNHADPAPDPWDEISHPTFHLKSPTRTNGNNSAAAAKAAAAAGPTRQTLLK